MKKWRAGIAVFEKATVPSHGFDGWSGLSHKHQKMLRKHRNDLVEKRTTEEVSLLAYIEINLKAGSTQSAAELVESWKASHQNPKTIEVTTDSPSVSTVTAASFSTIATAPSDSTEPVGLPAVAAAPVATPVATAPRKRDSASELERPSKKRKTSKAVAKISKKSSRRSSSDSPKQKSKNGPSDCRACDHDCLTDLIPYERSHFQKAFCAQENYPSSCTGCNKSLLPARKGASPEERENHCVIRDVFQVRCCVNAINDPGHKCVFALCHSCWSDLQASRSPRKKVRKAHDEGRAPLPGEVLGANGMIVARI